MRLGFGGLVLYVGTLAVISTAALQVIHFRLLFAAAAVVTTRAAAAVADVPGVRGDDGRAAAAEAAGAKRGQQGRGQSSNDR